MKKLPPLVRRIGLGALGIALLGAIAYVGFRAGPLAPTQITVTTIQEGQLKPALFGIGTVEAQRSWMVGPTSAGRVLQVKVDVGDTVHAGQLLAEMDPVDLSERLTALDAAQQVAVGAQAAAQAQVIDTQTRRTTAVATLKRNQNLAAQNFISPGALEARQQEVASADAALQAARANLASAASNITRQKAERAALAQQRGNLRLIAPANAVVTSRDAEAGTTVVAGQPVLRLVDPASLWVRLRLDQGRSGGLAQGLQARIVLRSQAQTPLSGHVARVDLVADSVTEERTALVAFDTPTSASVGEQAEVTLQLPLTEKTLLIPSAAVQRLHNVTGVWQLVDGKPTFAPVRLGISSLDGDVQVLEGLKAGDTVVVYSQKALTENARIKVVDALVKRQAKPAGATP
jgi:HlyD family secretion protein